MKKLIMTAAAASMIASSAIMAYASDSIDPMGKAAIAISRPAAKVVYVTENKVSLDSVGLFTASAPVVTHAVASVKQEKTDKICLDSICRINLKM
jgi:hypothetical protein